MDPFLLSLLKSNPLTMKVMLAVGGFRLVFKPLMLIVSKLVGETPTHVDDEILAKVKNSWTFQAVMWLVDYGFSIKLPPTPVEVPKDAEQTQTPPRPQP